MKVRATRCAASFGGRELKPDKSGGIGARTGSTTNSVAQTYLRDGAYVTDPVLKDSSATYTPGVSERRGSATTFLHSGLKNADAQTGTAQTVSATRRYDAFGNVVTSSGIWNGPFGYAGGFGYQEDATGLKLLGHRYYDSSTGRFLTRDPIKDGRNWYTYCWNDPISWMDADGQAPDGTFDPFKPNFYAPYNPPRLRYPGPRNEKPGKKEKYPSKGAPAAGEGKRVIPEIGGGVKSGGGTDKVDGSISTGDWKIGTEIKTGPITIKEMLIAAAGGDITVGTGGSLTLGGASGDHAFSLTLKDGIWTGSVQIGGGSGTGFGLSVDSKGRLTWGLSVPL